MCVILFWCKLLFNATYNSYSISILWTYNWMQFVLLLYMWDNSSRDGLYQEQSWVLINTCSLISCPVFFLEGSMGNQLSDYLMQALVSFPDLVWQDYTDPLQA